ncbi:hypothetical protein [uncultured Arcobacter sp.]|uniref:hypothetical protein n=1 Tax=uncultured Arcobacter sp. TaxID=165434 RepID=UPI00262D5069|nr:hypothetical protein [uncultured Arcobacter sp.]
MVWQKQRRRREFKCPKCHGTYKWEEYDEEEDMCLFCEFPDAQRHREAEVNYVEGLPVNQTDEGYVMSNLEDIPVNPRNEAINKQDRKVLRKIKKKKRNIYI